MNSLIQRLRDGCLVLIMSMVGIGAFCVITFIIGSRIEEIPNRNDSGAVAEAFVKALVRNDAGLARSLVTPEQLPRLDEWLAQHTAFSCRIDPFDIESEMTSGAGAYRDKENIDNWGYTYTCSDTGYYFEMHSIDLLKANNGYQITDWSEPCEGHSWSGGLQCN